LAKANNVILSGFVKGEKLQELFSHARLFVLPSYHEGLPISLLEAMSYCLPVLVSEIPANKQIALPENRFFMRGNVESLFNGLEKQLNCNFEPVNYDLTPYNWDYIAMQTKAVYEQVLK
jgi:glycosyltransferase involved in cell wall biosynthesis